MPTRRSSSRRNSSRNSSLSARRGSGGNAKKKLIKFLDQKAFDPVLRARAERYPENKRTMLKNVQRSTKSERARYHRYSSAQKIVDMFRNDLHSELAHKVHRELGRLGLPKINDFRGDFERLAQRLGVERGGGHARA